MSIQKFENEECCGAIRSPTEVGVRDLAMQRQPTPRKDPNREDHLSRRDDAVENFGNSKSALIDLSDLPSS